jgi:hypothetical protein
VIMSVYTHVHTALVVLLNTFRDLSSSYGEVEGDENDRIVVQTGAQCEADSERNFTREERMIQGIRGTIII